MLVGVAVGIGLGVADKVGVGVGVLVAVGSGVGVAVENGAGVAVTTITTGVGGPADDSWSPQETISAVTSSTVKARDFAKVPPPIWSGVVLKQSH